MAQVDGKAAMTGGRVSDSAKSLTARVQRRMIPARRQGAARAARILRAAMTNTETSQDQLGFALGIDGSFVARWTNETHEASFTDRDVFALEHVLPRFVAEYRRLRDQAFEPVPPSRLPLAVHGCLIAKEVGEAVGKLACCGATREDKLRELTEARATIDRAIVEVEAGAA